MKYLFSFLMICGCLLVFQPVAAANKININLANAKTLAYTIDGIGIKLAKQIVTYRLEHGLFRTIDELIKVRGVNLKTVELNRHKLTASYSGYVSKIENSSNDDQTDYDDY